MAQPVPINNSLKEVVTHVRYRQVVVTVALEIWTSPGTYTVQSPVVWFLTQKQQWRRQKRTFYRAKFKAEVSCFQNQRERMEPHYRKPLVHPFHLLFFFSPPLPISSSSKIWRWWLTSRDSNRAQFWRFRGCIFLPPPASSLLIYNRRPFFKPHFAFSQERYIRYRSGSTLSMGVKLGPSGDFSDLWKKRKRKKKKKGGKCTTDECKERENIYIYVKNGMRPSSSTLRSRWIACFQNLYELRALCGIYC